MPMCSVAGCGNYYEKTLHIGISYHKFPKDVRLQNIWIDLCQKDNINLAWAVVCSVHFDDNDFEDDSKRSLPKQGRLPRRLKSTAIPHLKMPGWEDAPESENQKERELHIVKVTKVNRNDGCSDSEPNDDDRHYSSDVDTGFLNNRLYNLEKENIALKRKIEDMEKEELNHQRALKYNKKRITKLTMNNHALRLRLSEMKDCLREMLTHGLID